MHLMSRDRRASARRIAVPATVALVALLSQASTTAASTVHAVPGDLSRPPTWSHSLAIRGPWYALVPGTQFVYDGTVVDETGSHHHRVVFIVTDLAKTVDGVRTRVVWDRDIQDGVLQEAELALFAQDDGGNVRSLGEYPEEYEDGAFAGAPSTWVSGYRGDQGGVLVPGRPRVGEPRFTEGKAPSIDFFDVGRVAQVGIHVCAPVACSSRVMVVEEWSPIARADGRQLKYYAPGVGLLKISADGGDSQETMLLTAHRVLSGSARNAADDAVRRLDRRGHQTSDAWSTTAGLTWAPGG